MAQRFLLALALAILIVGVAAPVAGPIWSPLAFARAEDPGCFVVDPVTGNVTLHPENCPPE